MALGTPKSDVFRPLLGPVQPLGFAGNDPLFAPRQALWNVPSCARPSASLHAWLY